MAENTADRPPAADSASSRRTFLALAGAGAAVAGTAAVLSPAPADAAPAGPAHPGPLVAVVRDTARGEVAVHVGEREVVVHDRDLARRIARIAGTER